MDNKTIEELQELAKQSANIHFNAKHEGDWYAHYYGFIYGFQKAQEMKCGIKDCKSNGGKMNCIGDGCKWI